MAKKGTVFERAVADIIRGFSNVSDVAQGEWRVGPDGRRDRDVSFTVTHRDRRLAALIECKDYDPIKTGPVGIGVVDAFDSKRRDLGIDIPIICSNAGFARPAITKAQRVGIRTIGALRLGDERITFEVSDVIFARKATITNIRLTMTLGGLRTHIDLSRIPAEKILIGSKPVIEWAMKRARVSIGANPVLNGSYSEDYRLIRPLIFWTPDGELPADRIKTTYELSGAWYKHVVKIDASNGLYDWVRRRVQRTPSGADVQIKGLDMYAGKRVAIPPEHVLKRVPFLPGEMSLDFVMLYGPLAGAVAPDLDKYVVPEDLSIIMKQLPPREAMRSKNGYIHPIHGRGLTTHNFKA